MGGAFTTDQPSLWVGCPGKGVRAFAAWGRAPTVIACGDATCPGCNHRLLPALAKNMPLACFLNASRLGEGGFGRCCCRVGSFAAVWVCGLRGLPQSPRRRGASSLPEGAFWSLLLPGGFPCGVGFPCEGRRGRPSQSPSVTAPPSEGDGKERVILHFAPKKYRNSKPAKACFFLFCVIE